MDGLSGGQKLTSRDEWRGRRRTPEFFREVTGRNEKGCWLWPGHIDRGGYATARFGHPHKKKEKAHRVSWEVANGRPIPDGWTVDHTCFVPSCVNPDHLQLLLPSENFARQRRSLSNFCKNGHEFTPENTRRRAYRNGARDCIACDRARSAAAYRERRRAKHAS